MAEDLRYKPESHATEQQRKVNIGLILLFLHPQIHHTVGVRCQTLLATLAQNVRFPSAVESIPSYRPVSSNRNSEIRIFSGALACRYCL